jgi:hypothetical protein
VTGSSNSPLRMTKMPITSDEALALLNGLQYGEKYDALNVRRVVLFVLVVMSLGIVIPLLPKIRSYLRMQRK